MNRLIQGNSDLFSESQCKVCNAVLISESQKLAHYQVAHFIFSTESNVCVFRNRFDLESTATYESIQWVDWWIWFIEAGFGKAIHRTDSKLCFTFPEQEACKQSKTLHGHPRRRTLCQEVQTLITRCWSKRATCLFLYLQSLFAVLWSCSLLHLNTLIWTDGAQLHHIHELSSNRWSSCKIIMTSFVRPRIKKKTIFCWFAYLSICCAIMACSQAQFRTIVLFLHLVVKNLNPQEAQTKAY